MQTAEITDPFLKEMLSNVSKQSRAHGHSLEYLEGALEWLLTQTRQKLTDKESVQFMAKLSVYPKWKLTELDGFSGRLGEVFAYLDAIQPKPADPFSELGYNRDAKQIPEEPESQLTQREQIAKDFAAHVAMVTKNIGDAETPEEAQARRQAEYDSYKRIDKKWPHLNVLGQIKTEKRFKNCT